MRRIVSCLHARNWNRKGFFLSPIANILLVSINFMLEKVFVRCFNCCDSLCCVVFEFN